ncbi:MAG: Asp23/Gls24 family envelope stress response protein [Thermotoga sp.]|nr:MAG: Asp23/Gls24 family envelope stress response protein [Thermotoga sp.]
MVDNDEKEEYPEETIGEIHVSDDVLIDIACTALTKVDGISLPSKKNLKRLKKDIKLERQEEGVSFKVEVRIFYGQKVKDVARAIQKTIMEEVHTYTGENITYVDVYVRDIVSEKEDVEKEEEKGS